MTTFTTFNTKANKDGVFTVAKESGFFDMIKRAYKAVTSTIAKVIKPIVTLKKKSILAKVVLDLAGTVGATMAWALVVPGFWSAIVLGGLTVGAIRAIRGITDPAIKGKDFGFKAGLAMTVMALAVVESFFCMIGFHSIFGAISPLAAIVLAALTPLAC